VVDGPALEASDLSAAALITSLCAPERLLRRAGRVNRRAEQVGARITVVGSGDEPMAPLMPAKKRAAYWQALKSAQVARPFMAREWKEYIR
jgi:CRISPR/Cas system-associated endonuclease/helicase Cas3